MTIHSFRSKSWEWKFYRSKKEGAYRRRVDMLDFRVLFQNVNQPKYLSWDSEPSWMSNETAFKTNNRLKLGLSVSIRKRKGVRRKEFEGNSRFQIFVLSSLNFRWNKNRTPTGKTEGKLTGILRSVHFLRFIQQFHFLVLVEREQSTRNLLYRYNTFSEPDIAQKTRFEQNTSCILFYLQWFSSSLSLSTHWSSKYQLPLRNGTLDLFLFHYMGRARES